MSNTDGQIGDARKALEHEWMRARQPMYEPKADLVLRYRAVPYVGNDCPGASIAWVPDRYELAPPAAWLSRST